MGTPTPQASLAALTFLQPEIVGSALSIDSTVLPFTVQADTLTIPWSAGTEFFTGDKIVDANGNVQIAQNHGFTGATVPTWSKTAGGTTIDNPGVNQISWVYLGFPLTTRIEVLIYNQTFTFTAGVHGFTASPLTAFTTFTGSVAIDQTVPETLVQLRGRNYDPSVSAVWVAGQTYAAGAQIIDNSGFVQTVLVPGTAGLSLPSFAAGIGGQTPDGTGTLVWINTGKPALTPTDKINLIFFQTNDAVLIAPPSGVSSYKNENTCRIEWALPTFPGFIGVRVMLSTDPTGVTVPFTQFGDLVNNVTRSQNVVIGSETATSVNGNVTTVTTTNTTIPVNYSSVDVTPEDVQNANIFYALISTVIQDQNTNAVFESQQNGPIPAGFVDLHVVTPSDFLPLQRKEDIASRLVTQITRLYPDLDLTPRSETRDILVDPFSLELANMSVREWFSRVSTSISAISQIDDANGDGFSDPFDQSPVKQQLSRAYGLSAADTQSLIDRQFDILGEQAGVSRGGAQASVVTLTFFSFIRPTTTVTFPIGIQVATVADANTPALTFVTRASATIDPQSADSFYNAEFGWFQVQVPAECATTGSIGNVGAGTIRSVTSGAPNGWNSTNLVAADFGQDSQTNSKFAANIQDSLVTGKDSGTRNGYLKAARGTPGVVEARVVAAGDLEMLRDWDPIRQKHVFGTVDIYVRGTNVSEQDTDAAFAYQNAGTYGVISSYLPVTLLDINLMKFNISTFNTLPEGVYTALEFAVTNGSTTLYFGTANAQFYNVAGTFTLDPNEQIYQYIGDTITKVKAPVPNPSNGGAPYTNRQKLLELTSTVGSNFSFHLIARLASPLEITPTLQPVLKATSVTGQAGQTGVIAESAIRLIHSSDFLLLGNSNNAGDEVAVNSTTSSPKSKSLTMVTNTVTVDTAMDLTIDTNGNAGDVISVRSQDNSLLYTFGVDYNLVPAGRYHTYALNLLQKTFGVTNVVIDNSGNLTVSCQNDFVAGGQVTFTNLVNAFFLNGQTVRVASATPTSFTAAGIVHAAYGPSTDTGNATGQNIASGATVNITYNQFDLYERLSFFANEAQTLNGTVPTPLAHEGFVRNTWLPESYGNTTLSLDGAVFNADGSINLVASTGLVGARVAHDNRYIKVTFNGSVMLEGIDYTLTVDPISGAATLARILTGHIGDASTVLVSYFTTETFTIATQFPAFVEALANTIAVTKHAAADVLVKAMVANGVDVSMTVELASTATPEVLDPQIRTIISIVMDNASGVLAQSQLVRQVQAITGVASIVLPLTKFAKTDGAYDIDIIIPTATSWLKLANDPAFAGDPIPSNSFITQFPVLPDSTIPSGGLADAFVGMLFEGQAFRRASSVQDFFLSTTPSFYIIGNNDQIDTAGDLAGYQQKILLKEDPTISNPGIRNYRVTYQVFNEGGTKDIVLSNTEYLVPGRITINYITGD